MWTKILFIASFIILLILTCGGSAWASATHAAASCSAANVQSAINASATGDLVTIPAGTCAWGGTVVEIPGSKTITLQGAGIGSTIITSTASYYALGIGTGSRVTGMDFTIPAGTTAIQYEINLATSDMANFRVDHCKFSTSTTALSRSVVVRGGSTIHGWGVIDNCEMNNSTVLIYWDANFGNYVDMSFLTIGNPSTPEQTVYVENNTINVDVENVIDQNAGGAYVFRNNTVNLGPDLYGLESHSNQGSRGSRNWEIYRNTFTFESAGGGLGMLRGGTGVAFDNVGTYSGTYTGNGWRLDNVRSHCELDPSPCSYAIGICDGNATNNVDGNTAGQQGWPCRDQPGSGADASLRTGDPWPTQARAPVYLWNSTVNSIQQNGVATLPFAGGRDLVHVVENRDFYNYNASFDGTTGVGVGTLASRSATCTTGVGYWATDQGSWNLSGSGGQGVLYKCTATNTWTSYYTPYTYPHPIRGVVAVPTAIGVSITGGSF